MSKDKSPEVQEDLKLDQEVDGVVEVKQEKEAATEKKEASKTEKQETPAAEKKDAPKAKKKSSKKTKKSKEEILQEQIDELTEERDELKDKYLRQYAEFDNFRKRTNKERFDLINTAGRKTITSLLPAIDDFDRAVKAAEADDNIEPLSEGVMLVYEKLKGILKQNGLKEMKTNGEVFNADFHAALTEIPAPTEDMKGKIIDTIEKGYMLNETIIRHARVVIGK